MRSFGTKIYNDELVQEGVLEEQIKFKNETDKLKESTMPKTYVKKNKKTLTFENVNTVLKERQNFPPGFESGVFLIKITDTRKRTYFRLSLPSQGLWP